jgi:RimJ/RimL family protein N-acetyltransferase
MDDMNGNTVTLRPFYDADQRQMLDILTDKTVAKTYMLPDFETLEAAIPLFDRLKGLSAESARYVRCIDLNGTAIGFLNDVEIAGGSIELGYVIHPAHQGLGYMTAALAVAMEELFATGYSCVICGAFEENRASQRVMEKCGMRRIEKIDEIPYRGSVHRCVYYQRESV